VPEGGLALPELALDVAESTQELRARRPGGLCGEALALGREGGAVHRRGLLRRRGEG
jgi:hypothetical protein